MQKTAPKNTKYSRNENILKIGHHAKAIAHAKSSLWVKSLNSKKHVKIHSTNHLELFCKKNRSKKHEVFENWDHFKNRPSCKGYSPCKILTLSQKVKFQKTCQNPFLESFRVVLCKKTARQNTKYSRNENILKFGHHAKAIAHAKSSLWDLRFRICWKPGKRQRCTVETEKNWLCWRKKGSPRKQPSYRWSSPDETEEGKQAVNKHWGNTSQSYQ